MSNSRLLVRWFCRLYRRSWGKLFKSASYIFVIFLCMSGISCLGLSILAFCNILNKKPRSAPAAVSCSRFNGFYSAVRERQNRGRGSKKISRFAKNVIMPQNEEKISSRVEIVECCHTEGRGREKGVGRCCVKKSANKALVRTFGTRGNFSIIARY